MRGYLELLTGYFNDVVKPLRTLERYCLNVLPRCEVWLCYYAVDSLPVAAELEDVNKGHLDPAFFASWRSVHKTRVVFDRDVLANVSLNNSRRLCDVHYFFVLLRNVCLSSLALLRSVSLVAAMFGYSNCK